MFITLVLEPTLGHFCCPQNSADNEQGVGISSQGGRGGSESAQEHGHGDQNSHTRFLRFGRSKFFCLQLRCLMTISGESSNDNSCTSPRLFFSDFLTFYAQQNITKMFL